MNAVDQPESAALRPAELRQISSAEAAAELSAAEESLLRLAPGSGNVQLRTLVLIRWFAIVGQAETLLFVRYGLDFPVPLAETLATVALGALLNFFIPYWHAGRPRLDERSAAAYLAFDIVQLSTLLYFTGGIDNPFTLLLIAPVAVSASILSRLSTLLLCILAVTTISLISFTHQPLPWSPASEAPVLPSLYTVATWGSIVVAVLFVALYGFQMAHEARRMSLALTEAQLSLASEQRVSALGTLAAAAAHELGTPLATIALVAKELARELPPDSPHAEDAALLVSQAERCRRILADLSRRPETEGDALYLRMSLTTLVEEVAARYRDPGIEVVVSTEGDGNDEPSIAPSPEIMHGLGNFLANATQFATERVMATIEWNTDVVRIVVADDGPGFPAPLLGQLGEPYVSGRRDTSGHMGLGVFIAKTLLGRTGAQVAFSNRASGGARVAVTWSRAAFESIGEVRQTAADGSDMGMVVGGSA